MAFKSVRKRAATLRKETISFFGQESLNAEKKKTSKTHLELESESKRSIRKLNSSSDIEKAKSNLMEEVPAPVVRKVKDAPFFGYEERSCNEEFQKGDIHLTQFPYDDFEVKHKKKVHKTEVEQTIQQYIGNTSPHVQELLRFFLSDWVFFTNKYTTYFEYDKEKSIYNNEEGLEYEQDWASSDNIMTKMKQYRDWMEKEKTQGEFEMHYEYIMKYFYETDQGNAELRSQKRFDAFRCFDPDFDWGKGVEVDMCKKEQVPFLIPTNCIQFIVQVEQLIFFLGEVEPFFGTLCLYNIRTNEKITENFYFDLNSISLGKFLPKEIDPETQAKQCVFSIPDSTANTDLYLVIKLESVWHGDIEVAQDPYLDKMDPKHQAIAIKKVVESLEVNEKYYSFRQDFAWGAIPVFKKQAINPETVTVQLFKRTPKMTDLQMLEAIAEMKDHPKNFEKKHKPFQSTCKISIREYSLSALGKIRLLDSSLNVVKNPGLLSSSSSSLDLIISETTPNLPIVREIFSFHLNPWIHSLNVDYFNTLYINPITVNFSSKAKLKNVGIKIQLKTSPYLDEKEPLKVFYGKSSSTKLCSYAVTQLHYQVKQPQFSDEIKIQLPLYLTSNHHLLFTFFTLEKKEKKTKKMETPIETPIGYAAVHLLSHEKILDSEYNLPIFTVKEEDRYRHNYLNENNTYLDDGKPLFSFGATVVSSIFSQNKILNDFFMSCQLAEREDYLSHSDKILKDIKELREVDFHKQAVYLPLILNRLLGILSLFSKTKLGVECIYTLINLVHKVYQAQLNPSSLRSPILVQYIEYVLDFYHKERGEHLFESIAENYLNYIKERKILNSLSQEDIISCWFIFDIIIKCMKLRLHKHEKLNSKESRVNWWNKSFVDCKKKLLHFIANYLKNRCNGPFGIGEFKLVIECNRNIALFIKELFNIHDRGVCVDLIRDYIKQMQIVIEDDASSKIVYFKFDYFRIIEDYVHFIPLNLPVQYNSSNLQHLLETPANCHPIIYLLCRDVIDILKSSFPSLRTKGISTLTYILTKHDYDARYSNPASKAKVAAMYLPLLVNLMETWQDPKLQSWCESAGLSEKKNLFACVIWVLKNCNKNLFSKWWKMMVPAKLVTFLEILAECVLVFEFQNPEIGNKDQKKGTASSFLNEPSRRKSVMPLNQSSVPTSPSVSSTPKKIERKSSFGTRKSSLNLSLQNSTKSKLKENYSNYEASLTVLDILEEFIQTCRDQLKVVTSTNTNLLMDKTFLIFLILLRTTQPISLLIHLFATWRSFILKFYEVFFIQKNHYVSELCLELLRFCNSAHYLLRSEASCLLYLFVKHSQIVGNYRRISVQLTTALSTLVSEERMMAEPEIFESSLSRLVSFSYFEYAMPESPTDIKHGISFTTFNKLQFVRQIEDLCGRLTKVLKDSIQVGSVRNKEPEHMADLYFRIAKGYMSTPELRVAWLEALFKLHVKESNFAEAAICMVHVACVISLYLQQISNQEIYGIELFKEICPKMNEVVEDDEEGLFNEAHLINAVKMGITYFKQSELYEFAIHLYKFLIQIYEKNRLYGFLSKSYAECQEIYNKMIKSAETRFLGKYYRIGFYGKKFQELDGKEFIYKEPQATHLFELTEKLVEFYSKQYGRGNVIVFPDSSKVDVSKLDPTKCYLQVTSLEPHFDNFEKRATSFERNTVLDQFMFTTPFTLSGESHANSIRNQYIRKTILTVDITFPYMLKRSVVASKREIVLSPIENAIESMEKRNATMMAELKTDPPNKKVLQGLLHGSILTMVQEGPIEFARQFLGTPGDFDINHINSLKRALQNFLNICESGISLNKTIIDPDQIQFQNALEEGFHKLKHDMKPFLSIDTPPSFISVIDLHETSSQTSETTTNMSEEDTRMVKVVQMARGVSIMKYEATKPSELSFDVNEVIYTEGTDGGDWVFGSLASSGKEGWFPISAIKLDKGIKRSSIFSPKKESVSDNLSPPSPRVNKNLTMPASMSRAISPSKQDRKKSIFEVIDKNEWKPAPEILKEEITSPTIITQEENSLEIKKEEAIETKDEETETRGEETETEEVEELEIEVEQPDRTEPENDNETERSEDESANENEKELDAEEEEILKEEEELRKEEERLKQEENQLKKFEED